MLSYCLNLICDLICYVVSVYSGTATVARMPCRTTVQCSLHLHAVPQQGRPRQVQAQRRRHHSGKLPVKDWLTTTQQTKKVLSESNKKTKWRPRNNCAVSLRGLDVSHSQIQTAYLCVTSFNSTTWVPSSLTPWILHIYSSNASFVGSYAWGMSGIELFPEWVKNELT